MEVRTSRRRKPWRLWPRRLAALVILLVVAVAAVAAVGLTIRQAGRYLLWENNDYLCRRVDVVVEGALPPENVIEFLNLPDKLNLWELLIARRLPAQRLRTHAVLNIDQMRERFLARVPSVASMEIAVRLPDALEIMVAERVPLASIDAGGRFSDFVVDRHGVVFFAPRQEGHLPVIAGLSGTDIRPGSDLRESLAAALNLLATVRHPDFNREIRVRGINVANSGYLECWLDTGTRVRISWPEMHKGPSGSDAPLKLKLASLRSVLLDSRDRGRRPLMIDLTMTEDNIPVTFN